MKETFQILKGKTHDIGGGLTVRRCLPHRQKPMVGPFIFWDHMGPRSMSEDFELTVRAHPHIGLGTITYLFSGELVHRDSLGIKQVIRPGEVNWMVAGKGIAHSERGGYAPKYPYLEGIQLWMALPVAWEECEPFFQHVAAQDLPSLTMDGISWTLIAGEFLGQTSPVKVKSPLFYLKATLQAGEALNLAVPKEQEGAVYPLDGEIRSGDQGLGPGELLVFEKGEPLRFHSETGGTVLVFGGEPLPEPRRIWWNLVSSRQELIEKAKEDWQAGRFPPVVDETEWIPLPEK